MGAVNSAGDGAWSATGTPQSPAAPGRVPHIIGGGSDGSIFVSWVSPADDGGADITAYDLRYIRSDAANKVDANWTVEEDVWSSGALQYELGDLTDGVRYDVQLRAVTSTGDGPWSA